MTFRHPQRVVIHGDNGDQHHMDFNPHTFQLMMASFIQILDNVDPHGNEQLIGVLEEAKHHVRGLQGNAYAVRVEVNNPTLVNLWRYTMTEPLTRLVFSVNDSARSITSQLCQFMHLEDQPKMSTNDLYTLVTGYIYSGRCYDVLLCSGDGRLMVRSIYDNIAGLNIPGGPQLRLPHPDYGFDLIAILTEYHIGTLMQGAPYYID